MVNRGRIYLSAILIPGLMMVGCTEKEAGNGKPEAAGNDETAGSVTGTSYDLTALLAERKEKDEYFRQTGSPIPEEQRTGFTGLRYYPPDSSLAFNLKLARLPQPEPANITATKGDVRKMERYGTFSFTVNGKPCTLTAYTSATNPDNLFVPFKDATNDVETYGVGRYLDLEIKDDDLYQLDFNRAYNPYCAYNPGYTCPLVPLENVLDVAIRAGEMLPADAGH